MKNGSSSSKEVLGSSQQRHPDDVRLIEVTVKSLAIVVNVVLIMAVLYKKATLFLPWMIVYGTESLAAWSQALGFFVIFQGRFSFPSSSLTTSFIKAAT